MVNIVHILTLNTTYPSELN